RSVVLQEGSRDGAGAETMKKVEQSPAAHRRRSGVSALHSCEGGAGSSYGHGPCGSLTEAWAMTACRRDWGSPLCDHRGDGVERRRPCGDRPVGPRAGGRMEQARGGRSGQRERIVIRGAYVLTCDGADRVSPSGDIVIDAGRITAVGQVADEAVVRGARVIEGRDRLVAPGLINAHMHSTSTLLKGTADHLSHPAFMWRKQ